MSQLRAGKLPGVSPYNSVVGAVLAKRVETCPRQKSPSMPTPAASVAFSSTCRPCSRVTYLRRQYFCQSLESPNWASGQRWMAKVWLPNWLSPVSALRFNTRMAVMTTMMENTPINTPSRVSAERSLCAVSAFMAIEKLSWISAEQQCGFMKFHSLLNASTGSIRAARQAGRKPETTPVNSDTSRAMPTMVQDKAAGNSR